MRPLVKILNAYWSKYWILWPGPIWKPADHISKTKKIMVAVGFDILERLGKGVDGHHLKWGCCCCLICIYYSVWGGRLLDKYDSLHAYLMLLPLRLLLLLLLFVLLQLLQLLLRMMLEEECSTNMNERLIEREPIGAYLMLLPLLLLSPTNQTSNHPDHCLQ